MQETYTSQAIQAYLAQLRALPGVTIHQVEETASAVTVLGSTPYYDEHHQLHTVTGVLAYLPKAKEDRHV